MIFGVGQSTDRSIALCAKDLHNCWSTRQSPGCAQTVCTCFLIDRPVDRQTLQLSDFDFDRSGGRPTENVLKPQVSVGDSIVWPVDRLTKFSDP